MKITFIVFHSKASAPSEGINVFFITYCWFYSYVYSISKLFSTISRNSLYLVECNLFINFYKLTIQKTFA